MKYLLYISFIIVSFSIISCSSDEDIIDSMEDLGVIDTIKVISEFNVNDSLSVSKIPEIEIEKFFSFKTTATTTNQGFAIYNNRMFQCYHTNNIIDIIDLDVKKVTNSILLEPEELVHCNDVNFGGDFYDSDDRYPLLYVQQRGYANKLNAYRIVSEGDTLFSASLVQTISFTPCSYSVTSISKLDNTLYVIFGYNKVRYLSIFYVPFFRDGDINIEIRNALKTYILPCSKVVQDTAADDENLYFLCGVGKEGELWRINMNTKEATVIDFPNYNLKGEPEGIDCYEDGLLVSFLGRIVYKVRIS